MRVRTTSRDYARPSRPLAVRLANRVIGALPLPPMDAEALLAEARAAEGLEAFGDPDPAPALTRLCAAIRDEARLHPVGHLVTRGRLVATLRHRLRARALELRHPEIVARPVEAPVFVIGLQRTGTTKLQRLLARDPRLRSLPSWEALTPIPPVAAGAADRRRLAAQVAAHGARWMSPDFYAVHPMLAEDVEEDVLLLDASLLSTVAEATMRVPGYSAWLEAQDQVPAYALHRRYLQHLSWQRGGGRWLLKSPHHLEWLDALLTVYPDARLVMTHRDPRHTVPSFCSMLAHGRGILSDDVDPHEIGRTWLRKTARLVGRALDTLDRIGPAPVLHVRYDDLMADPLGELRRVHAHLGLDTPPAVEAALRDGLAEAPQHRFGRHVYDAADFGLDAGAIDDAFATYRARFGFA